MADTAAATPAVTTSTFTVEIRRSIVCTVHIDAADEQAALDIVNRCDFELPPRDEWDGMKDWSYLVYDADGNELLDVSR